MYVCICLVARINQRVFRNSSLQMFYNNNNNNNNNNNFNDIVEAR